MQLLVYVFVCAHIFFITATCQLIVSEYDNEFYELPCDPMGDVYSFLYILKGNWKKAWRNLKKVEES